MSEVHDILSTLKSDVKVSSCLSLELLHLNISGECSLPGIN